MQLQWKFMWQAYGWDAVPFRGAGGESGVVKV